MANTLMFEVGIKEADNQLTELEKRLKNIVNTYGKLELKVQVDGLKTFTSALENIGQGKGLEALQRRLDLLQVTLSNAGMAGVKSMQEFEAAVKVNSTVADQYRKRIEELTAVRNKFIENTEPWRKANERLNSFQNDKNTLAIFAQEQVAIKNLEDAKTRLSNTNNQEAESYNKVVSSINTLNAAANTLKATLGSWDPNKGSIGQLVEQFEKLKNEIAAVASGLKNIDPAKLNFSGLNIDLGKVAGIGDLNTAIRGLEVSINEIINLFTRLGNAVKLDASSEIIKKLQADADAAQKTIQELTERMNSLAAAQKNVAETASKTGKSEKQISDSQTAMFNRYNKLLADIQNIKREIVGIQQGTGGGGPFGDKLGEYFSALNKIRNVAREITSSPSIADAITRGMSSEQLAKLNSALASLKTNYKEVISDAKDFNKATDKGSSQAEARIRKLGMAFNELKNYMKANGGSEEMKRLQTEIQGAIRKMRDLMNAGRFGEAVNVYERLSGVIRQAATATKEFERAQHSVSSTVSHTNSQLQGQSQILSDLKSMAMQYLSVWGAQSFINNIIELGGQLEQQRLSIGAILQDTAQANHLFSQIKDLAIKSPFGVQQLDAMTKQLSAYGFQYSELYEWTKRLADISAATGTSVDRLALALGHVRSEGALSGYTLRQFSMGNIPLLQKLSENLGKTKQEIRKMTRNKEIGYEDVLNVLKQLTDESGMFYQAQETMAQALNAKFKNLRDSFQIMYSEMAEGAPGDFLKGVAEVLTDISKSWRVLMPVILSGGATLGVWKLSTMALNHELERSGKLLVGNAIATSKYSMNQLRAIATTGRWTTALHGLGRAMMSIGKFIFNPVTLGFAAVEGLIYLWSKHNEEVRKAADLTKAFGETSVESEKNINKMLSKINPYKEGMDESAMKSGIDSMTEALKNYGVNAQEILNKAFGKDSEDNIMSLAEKYQYLRGELEKTAEVYKEMKKTADAFEYGINASDGGWLDDNVETDLTQYANAIKDFETDVTKYSEKYGDAIKKAVDAAEAADPAFRRATQNMSTYGQKLAEFWENQDRYGLGVNAARYYMQNADSEGIVQLQEGYADYLKNKNEALAELDKFFASTEERLKEQGYKFEEQGKHLSEAQVGNLLKQSKEWMEKHPEWENIYSVIEDKLDKRWGIKIVPDTSPIGEELPKWMEDFQKELNKTGIVLTADMSMEQIIDLMKKAYDQAQTTINKLGPIAIKAGIKLEGLTDETVEKYKFLNPGLYETLKELKTKLDSQGQIDTAGKKRGVNFKGMRKDGTHKAEKQNQEAAKAVREQVRVIKEAADAFQYWRDKVGDKGAWEHVQAEFGDVLNKIGITANNIEDVRGRLKEIPQMKEYKAITDKKVKTEIDKEIAKDNDQFIRKDFERDTEKFLSQTKLQLDNLTRAWEKFNTVREATGDIDLAVRISGVTYLQGEHTLADATRKYIEQELAKLNVNGIAFDVNIDPKALEESVWEAFERNKPMKGENETKEEFNARLSDYQEKIKGIIELMKEWQKMQRDVESKDLQVYGQLTSKAVDLATQLRKVNQEYKDQLDSLERMKNAGTISQSQYDYTKRISDSEHEMKRVQAQKEYQFLMDGVITMNKEAARTIRQEYVDALKGKLRAGTITAKEYADKIEDINAKMRELEKVDSDSMAYLKGGTDGMIANMQRRAKAYQEMGAQEMQEGQQIMDVAQAMGNSGLLLKGLDQFTKGDKMDKMGQGMSEMANGMGETLDYVGAIVHGIDGFVQGAKAIIDEVEEMNDALGEHTAPDDVNTFWNSFSAASSKASQGFDSLKNGDFMGAFAGVVGSFTSWITGFAKGHDAKRDYSIKLAEQQLNVLKRIDSRVENSISRTLGGGMFANADEKTIAQFRKMLGYREDFFTGIMTGDMEKMFPSFVSWQGRDALAISQDTAEALKNFVESQSAYSASYLSLLKQRDEVKEQLAAEQDKKDKSDEAIEEYEQKLYELEDQIKYFVEDTAKELWGLDLKGWASQIGDALMTAFENGEDAAKAFEDTAKDIMRSVASNMLKLGIIEPMMDKLREELFEQEYTDSNGNKWKGVYNTNTGRFDQQQTLEILGKYFGQGGELEKTTEASKQFYDWVKDITGINLDDRDSSSSASNTIRGITEQTADLLVSYVSAMRADLSVIRELDGKAVLDYWPSQIRLMTSSNDSLANIEQHTAAIMMSNDAIANSVNSLDERFRRLENKAWKMPIA